MRIRGFLPRARVRQIILAVLLLSLILLSGFGYAITTAKISPTTTYSASSPTSSVLGAFVQQEGEVFPALYGGSKSKVLADKEGQLRFLDQNPKKAAAFCAALNSDPTCAGAAVTRCGRTSCATTSPSSPR